MVVIGQRSEFFPIHEGVTQRAAFSPILHFIAEDAMLQELHAGHIMDGSFARGTLACLYGGDLVGIAFTADCLQSDIFSACGRYARRHRHRASVPTCGVVVCIPAASSTVVQAQPARTCNGATRISPGCLSADIWASSWDGRICTSSGS